MDERKAGFHQRIAQVRKVLVNLRRHQHAFVDHGFVREARNVKTIAAFEARIANGIFRPLADDVEFALESHRPGGSGFVAEGGILFDKDLADARLGSPGGFAQRAVVCGNGAPAENLLAFFRNDLFKELLAIGPFLAICWQKNETASVMAGCRQFDIQFVGDLAQKTVRSLQEDASAVAGIGFATASAAVIEVNENLERLLDDLV